MLEVTITLILIGIAAVLIYKMVVMPFVTLIRFLSYAEIGIEEFVTNDHDSLLGIAARRVVEKGKLLNYKTMRIIERAHANKDIDEDRVHTTREMVALCLQDCHFSPLKQGEPTRLQVRVLDFPNDLIDAYTMDWVEWAKERVRLEMAVVLCAHFGAHVTENEK